jgi:hypothetical protein
MPEKLVGLVKAYEHRTGTWMVTIPKGVATKLRLPDAAKKGGKMSVLYDEEKSRPTNYESPERSHARKQ